MLDKLMFRKNSRAGDSEECYASWPQSLLSARLSRPRKLLSERTAVTNVEKREQKGVFERSVPGR